MQGDMWYHGRVIEKKGLILVLSDELEGFLVNTVRGIFLTLKHIVTPRVTGIGALGQRGMTRHRRFVIEGDAFLVAPKIIRIIAVGVSLAVVTEETVKSLIDGIAFRTGST
jgi:hypothetical protein